MFQPDTHRTTVSSATVTATASPRNPPPKTTLDKTMQATSATSQPTPVDWRWCGSGGDAPDGRRRRVPRVTGGAAWVTGARTTG